MPSRCLTAILTATLAAACASGPSGPPPFDPVGTYDFTAVLEGQDITGIMTIEPDEGGYTGQLSTPTLPLPPAPITSVEVEKQTVRIEAVGPEGPLYIDLVVSGETLEGIWAMGEGSGSFTAIRSK